MKQYTMTREEFVRAVNRATRSKKLREQAKRQERFPLATFYDAETDCGCVVGEVLMRERGKRTMAAAEPEFANWLTDAGVHIDAEVAAAVGSPAGDRGTITILDEDGAA